MSARLFDLITVHCFACPHTVEGTSPDEAHDLMEAHYSEKHSLLIRCLTEGVSS